VGTDAGGAGERGPAGSDTQVTFHVAVRGNDAWSGTLAEPNLEGTDGPFATLRRARDAVRQTQAEAGGGGARRPVTVAVHGGKYFMEEPLVLTEQDGGASGAPVIYTAAPGERPVLSGGRRVTGWRPYRDGILHADLPGSGGGKWPFRQLFCNGIRMPRARWPRPDPADPLHTGWASIEGPAGEDGTMAFRYKRGAFRHHWAKPTEVEVNVYPFVGWLMKTVPIAKIDEAERTITLAYTSWDFDVFPWYMAGPFRAGNRCYVENALEDLDLPGQWCFDSEEGVVYFRPPAECGSIDECEVVVPALDSLITIRGASWLTVSGFTFTETLDGDNVHPQGTYGLGAMAIRAGPRDVGNALQLRAASHCRIERNHFRDVGGNAVYLLDNAERNVVRHNEISGAGANGICVAGSPLRHPVLNEISDNHIHHCGVLNKYIAGVTLGASDGNFVRHNRIEHMPHHAVNLADNPNGRNFIEYNEIRWVCREIADNAAINCWMELGGRDAMRRGHVIRFNYIADVYGAEMVDGKLVRSRQFPTSGIYLDNHASNCLVYGNIIVRCGMAGILIHNGRDNIIENNIFIDCGSNVRLQDVIISLEYWKDFRGFMTGNVFERNICLQTGPKDVLFVLEVTQGADRVLARSSGNVFCRPAGDYRLRHSNWLAEQEAVGAGGEEDEPFERIDTLDKWQALGFDTDACLEDPCFVDPDNDDYRLRPESPALKRGFQPIDVSRIGVREPS